MNEADSAALVLARRFLHTNYNCRDVDVLERWYGNLFGLRTVMRSTASDTDGIAHGLRQEILADTAFLYDRRGARRATALELVGWTDPPVTGEPYRDPWDHGIHAIAYTVPDVEATIAAAQRSGGRLVRRSGQAALLRDPEGVAVEVIGDVDDAAQAHHMRIVVKDLARTTEWYAALGLTTSSQMVLVPAGELWHGDGEHAVTAEAAMVATDDPTYANIFTTWSGPPPRGPPYGSPAHNGLYRMALAVDDVPTTYDALRTAGVATYPPYTFPLPGTPIGEGLTILFLRDPDGIVVELVERPQDRFR
jgi:catechol 2,3-dioxygenase-like lactoylglutathione lyase family enzyme